MTETMINMNEMSFNDLMAKVNELNSKVENRKRICRESSKKYYNKTFKLGDTPTPEEVKKNKTALQKRDKYQSSYYEKNAEKIKARQKAYRARKKAEKEAEAKEDYEQELKQEHSTST